jgi:hypothetical protein
MQLPVYFEYFDEDDSFSNVTAERQLFLAVFATAIVDLVGSCKSARKEARSWFTNGDTGAITFNQIKSMFKFKESRLKLLDDLLHERIKLKRTFRRKYRNHAVQQGKQERSVFS